MLFKDIRIIGTISLDSDFSNDREELFAESFKALVSQGSDNVLDLFLEVREFMSKNNGSSSLKYFSKINFLFLSLLFSDLPITLLLMIFMTFFHI